MKVEIAKTAIPFARQDPRRVVVETALRPIALKGWISG